MTQLLSVILCETERQSFMLENAWQNFKVAFLFNHSWMQLQCVPGILSTVRDVFLFADSELLLLCGTVTSYITVMKPSVRDSKGK